MGKKEKERKQRWLRLAADRGHPVRSAGLLEGGLLGQLPEPPLCGPSPRVEWGPAHM